MLRRQAFDHRTIERYLRTTPVRKLQLGTGPNPLPGWLNTDLNPDLYPEHRHEIAYLDVSRRFPLADMTFDVVFAEHLIEHMSHEHAVAMISECFRVLRPGGRVRIATPDFAAVVGIHDDPADEFERHYVDWVMARFWPHVRSGNPRCYVINKMFTGHGHCFIYDERTLAAMLAEAGFVEIASPSPGDSATPDLRGLESHGRALGDEIVNRFETMVLEARRPAAPR